LEKEIEKATEYYISEGCDELTAREWAEKSVLFEKGDYERYNEIMKEMLS